jgi:hypothetical protein
MHGFQRAIAEACVSVGVDPVEIFAATSLHGSRATTLPGFFRATKNWDLLVVRDGRVLAVIETKSQVGSFGNNYNNRSEEAVGAAVDLWTAYREHQLGENPPPWLGYVFVLSDESGSRTPVTVGEHHFRVDPAFIGASYARRYEELLRRLVRERHYNAACFLLTAQEQAHEALNYLEPAADLGAELFIDQLVRAVAPLPPGEGT